MSPVIKRFALVLALPLALLACAYASWPWWSISLARSTLDAWGIDVRRATITRPGLDAITLSDLQLDITLPGYLLALRSEQLTIRYRPGDLLRGRIGRVHIPQLQLTLTPGETAVADDSQPPLSAAALLPRQILQRIPVAEMSVPELSLESPLLREYGPLRGNFSLKSERLQLQLDSSGAGLSGVRLTAASDNSLAAELNIDQATALQIDSVVSDDSQLTGKLQLDLGLTRSLLTRLRLLQLEQIVSGELSLSWSAALPTLLADTGEGDTLMSGQFTAVTNVQLPSGDTLIAANATLGGNFTLDDALLKLQLDVSKLSARGRAPVEAGILPAAIPDQPIDLELLIEAGARLSLATSEAQPNSPLSLQQLDASLRIATGESANNNASAEARLRLKNAALQMNLASLWNPGVSAALTSGSNFSLQARLDQLQSEAISANGLELQASGAANFDAGQLRIETDSATLLAATKAGYGSTIQVSDNRISVAPALALSIDRETLRLPAAHLSARIGEAQLDEVKLHFAEAQLALGDVHVPLADVTRLGAEIELQVHDLVVRRSALQTAAAELQSQLSLQQQQLQGELTVEVAGKLITAHAQLRHHLDSGAGTLQANLQTATFNTEQAYLPRLLQPLPVPVDVTAGAIDAEALVAWKKHKIRSSEATLSLHQVDGFYRRNLVHGLDGSLHVADFLGQWSASSDSLQIRSADTGLAIANIGFALGVEPPRVDITGFRAELLGGTASQNAIVYDWSKPQNPVTIELENIQLSQLLELESGIKGSGTFDGRLPLLISDAGVRIANGQLRNRPPGGVIQYQSSIPVGNSALDAGLQITLDSLKNFHYTLLSAQADSDAAGNLTLQAKIHGRNPDLKQQQPVHFNLNITENIPALLKSLKLTQNLSDALERRIEALYNTGQQDTQR